MKDFNGAGIGTKNSTPKSFVRVPGKAEIAICNQFVISIFNWFEVNGVLRLLKANRGLNGAHDFYKSFAVTEPKEQLHRIWFTNAWFFPPLHPVYKMNVCLQMHSTLYLKPWSFRYRREMTFWHSVNGKCMLAIENESWGYAFSLWLTTANQNFLASCLFTTFIDPLVLFSCALLCAFLLWFSTELFVAKETKGSRTLWWLH